MMKRTLKKRLLTHILQKIYHQITNKQTFQFPLNHQFKFVFLGKIRLKPGCDALQSLESEVNGLLGKVRENCGKEALGEKIFIVFH